MVGIPGCEVDMLDAVRGRMRLRQPEVVQTDIEAHYLSGLYSPGQPCGNGARAAAAIQQLHADAQVGEEEAGFLRGAALLQLLGPRSVVAHGVALFHARQNNLPQN